jgi:uncharacterized protein
LTSAEALILFSASAAAGAINSIAGGGTLLTFPTLIFVGTPSIVANATSTVSLWPGSAAGFVGYRREVRPAFKWLRLLILPSVLGGALGAWLLLRTTERAFTHLAPFLLLFGTIVFMSRQAMARWLPSHRFETPTGSRLVAAWLLQFGVALYGGYFGAGIGILMLAILDFLGLPDIHASNGLKNFLAFCINSVAAAYFALYGRVDWMLALVMLPGAIVGGYAGAHAGRRVSPQTVRKIVIAIGFVFSAVLLYQAFRR